MGILQNLFVSSESAMQELGSRGALEGGRASASDVAMGGWIACSCWLRASEAGSS
jgi:hypothetical protein